MTAPLDDITVIEIDSWMAAPSAGAILADMGANVIKIEPFTGDPMRNNSRPVRLPEETKHYDYQFDVDNRGKRSITVDLDKPEGAALVRRLCETADIFMCNLLAQRQAKFGLDPATMLAVNPRLVHATLTGYGTTGPEAWRPGYDVTAFFGRSGIYDAMREGVDGPVPMARPAQGDHTTGLAMVGAILGALRLAERTGEGQVVETSLYETAVWTQATDYAITAQDRTQLRPRDRHHMIIPTANRYPCGDGKWVVLNMPEDAAWTKLCRLIGLEHLLEDDRLQDLKGRFTHMPEIVTAIDGALSTRTRDEWGEIFDANGVIWGPVLGLHEVVEDPQAEALGLFPILEDPEIGEYRSVAHPLKFKTADVGPKGPAPKLGQHTLEVLRDAGLDEAEIAALREGDAIGPLPSTAADD
jgi:crotonobetainyl-CoA:carnitine CoA-transferase CaiB-like acyl-CoA transferase